MSNSNDTAAAKKSKDLTINIAPDEIVGSEIYKSKDYRYASVGVKRGDSEYMRITYEWKGESVPDFVMSVMGWMQANNMDINNLTEEFASLKKRC